MEGWGEGDLAQFKHNSNPNSDVLQEFAAPWSNLITMHEATKNMAGRKGRPGE